ncbi:MAG: LysM peptidoglycan-binding domain-containing protein, partial [Clostridiales bacterium]|nr:LysM peptidoglycan-binding domain-containing protein [Clostridiales bacterium]
IWVQDAKAVGNKLVIKAEAFTTAIFLNENDGGLFDSTFSTQFSQIIEVDTYGENADDSVIIQLKDAEFTAMPGKDGGYAVSAQFHMSAQAVCRERKNLVYVADAYSNVYNITTENTEIKVAKCPIMKNMRLSMRGKPQQKTELSEIMYVSATAVCAESEDNKISVRALISGAGKSENGEFEAIEVQLSAEESVDLLKGQRLNILAVLAEQPTAIGSPHNVELAITINVEYCISETSEISVVSAMETDEEGSPKNQNSPSLVVICSEREADLWSLAKKYGSTMDMIKKANSIDGEFSINRRPIIIPKAY